MFEMFTKRFRKPEVRASDFETVLTGMSNEIKVINRDEAMNIPAVSACVDFIASTIAGLPIKLYRETDEGAIEEIEDDYRLKLVNDETGDLLDANQFKKSIIIDYLLEGAGYALVNKKNNKIVSLNYVDTRFVNVVPSADPVFKSVQIYLSAKEYRDFNVFRMCRNSKDGVTGVGVIQQNPLLFKTMYNALKYENNAIGYGTKKGFLKSKYRLDQKALDALKTAWRKMYSTDVNNNPDIMILNEGVSFEATSSTAIENQLDENKRTNSELVYNIFGLTSALFNGNLTTGSADVYISTIKTGVLPIAWCFNTALNKFLLLEKEKGKLFFSVDTSEILKSDILTRYQAYDSAIKAGWMQVDEVRKEENMSPIGLDFVKLGLDSVLYDPKTKQIYVANTNTSFTLGEGNAVGVGDIDENDQKGGEKDEDRNQI